MTCPECSKFSSFPPLYQYQVFSNLPIPTTELVDIEPIQRVILADVFDNLLDKLSWAGCGSHVPGVMDSIPEGEWCVVSLAHFNIFPHIRKHTPRKQVCIWMILIDDCSWIVHSEIHSWNQRVSAVCKAVTLRR